MTVCIAAICDNGQRVVAATDGALTLGGVTADVLVPGKMVWFNDWLLLWAGVPGNIDLVLENIREIARRNAEALKRENIRRTVNTAFRRFAAEWTADQVLTAYDMSMSEFKKSGKDVFGEAMVKEMSKKMNDAVRFLEDELIVIGWGKTEHAAMLHQRSAHATSSGALSGVAAIGSGCDLPPVSAHAIIRRCGLG